MNFKKSIDRTMNKEKKWDPQYLAYEHNINTTKKIYNLSIADFDFKSPKPIVDAIVNRARKGTYSYTFVEDESLEAIKTWYDKYHKIDIDTSWISLTHGTVNTIFEIVKCFTKEGESVIITTPVYRPFEYSVLRTNRNLVTSELKVENNYFEIDFTDFEEKIKKNDVKIFIFCNPHNPGGRVWKKQEIDKIVEICNKYDVLIIADEVHSDLLYEGHHCSLLLFEKIKKTIVCNSPNKLFNVAGLKGSFLICKNKELKKAIDKQYEYDSLTTPNIFFQPTLQTAYTDDYCLEWVKEFKTLIRDNVKMCIKFFKKFAQIDVMEAEASFLLWIRLNGNLNWVDLKKDFISENIIFNYGGDFSCGGDEWLRINVGLCPSELQEVLNKMKLVLNRRGIK